MKTKVFLSCGQQHGTEEPKIADNIRKCLEEEFDFECYIAVAEQSLLGLRENLFRQLDTSEYFLFIDFKRESLNGRENHRGSLFSHQELAIASYLKIETLIFQEAGMKERDGMLGCFQGNALRFENRQTLVQEVRSKVAEKLKKTEWSNSWIYCLSLHLSPKLYDGKIYGLSRQGNQAGPWLAHFHLAVRNNHRRTHAQHCFVYLDRIQNIGTGVTVEIETTELKWAGSTIPDVIVAAKTSRRFDAFQIYPDSPDMISCKVFSDSTEFIPSIRGLGTYWMTYAVRCANFPTVEKTFEVVNTGNIDTVSIAEV